MKGYTLHLDGAWDITLDNVGKIATTSGAYAVAQNVANAQRLFIMDAYFNQRRGIPHFETELGSKFPLSASVLRTRMKKAALGVEHVKTADVQVAYEDGRVCGSRTTVTLDNGAKAQIES